MAIDGQSLQAIYLRKVPIGPALPSPTHLGICLLGSELGLITQGSREVYTAPETVGNQGENFN